MNIPSNLLLCAALVFGNVLLSNASHISHSISKIMFHLTNDANEANWKMAQDVWNNDDPGVFPSKANTVEKTATNFHPQVETNHGLVRGAAEAEAHVFYNVPYAQQPVGELRFQQPKPLEDNYTDGTLDASVARKIYCFQAQECSDSGGCFSNFTEECLVVNVCVPTTVDLSDPTSPPSERLPVIAWIHGGGFMFGSANNPSNNCRFLSNVTNAIVVGINYRLGVFGFMAFSENGEEVRGNQGLHDQQLGLRWIQENIEKFGGDKSKVAIVGQSAGAQSVMFHLLSERSKDLFSSAIQMSNPAAWRYQTFDEALNITEVLIEKTNCTDKRLECLREIHPKELVTAGYRSARYYFKTKDLFGVAEPWRAILDGDEFKMQPMEAFRDGAWNNDKPIVMGSAADEIYIPAYWPFNMRKELYQRVVTFALGEDIGPPVYEYYDKYAVGSDDDKDYRSALAMVTSDGLFICPISALSRFASKTTTSKVYRYSFEHKFENQESCSVSGINDKLCSVTYHAMDVLFLFRTFDTQSYNYTMNDMSIANQYAHYWANLAAGDDPNSGYVSNLGSFPEWPAYVEENMNTARMSNPHLVQRQEMNFNSWSYLQQVAPEPNVLSSYHRDKCDFWDSLGYYLAPTPNVPGTTTTKAEEAPATTDEGEAVVTTTYVSTTSTGSRTVFSICHLTTCITAATALLRFS